MPLFARRGTIAVLTSLLFATVLHAQAWSQRVRGSWVQQESPRAGDIVLVRNGAGCELVVPGGAGSAVHQAAVFLAGDIEKISGCKPPIVAQPGGGRAAIRFATIGDGQKLPDGIAAGKLAGQWEAYQVLTTNHTIWLVGSDFRGTAYAAYTLCERLGIDPLYIWTGYTPERHPTLVLKQTDWFTGPPTFKYRGFFHDDEDILPRPLDDHGYPSQTGTVPKIWYERFFETALRLRLNMVAPYVRVHRPYDVQKMASDWGLFYTSHHYDILLSNPWGFERFGLGAKRHAGTEWDWFKNKEGMINFWRGGVEENRDLYCIWPVGLRGTADRGYTFPSDMTTEQKNAVFRDVIDTQVNLTKQLVPKDKPPAFHFTLYTEMLDLYRSGKLDLPDDVIVVWTDDNDGRMRALPTQRDRWKHGVYYHLAYFTTHIVPTKQVTHIVSPMRVADEFQRIVAAGATEYMLLNVSELREYTTEARMIAEICWDAPQAFGAPRPADRYLEWWAREYFGAAAAADVVTACGDYYRLLDSADKIWFGGSRVLDALAALDARFNRKPGPPLDPKMLVELEQRAATYRAAMAVTARASAEMRPEPRQYFFENVTLGLLIDARQTNAAILLLQAVNETDSAKARTLCFSARDELQKLEDEIRRAERPPFEHWYRKTWIRNDDSPSNVHRSYERVQAFLQRTYPTP